MSRIAPDSKRNPMASVPLPISPKTVAASLVAASEPGITQALTIRQAINVPANGSANITIPISPGNVMIVSQPIRVFSNLYSAEVTATLVVDEVNVLWNDFPLTAEAFEIMPEYGVIRSSVRSVILNGTQSAVEVTYDGAALLVEASYYDRVIATLMRYGAGLIRKIVAARQESA